MAFTDLLHIETVFAGPRRAEAVMPVAPDLLQPYGYLHGGATIALLETVASVGAEQRADAERERPFGVDVRVRHRKSAAAGTLRGVAELAGEETSARTGAVKQHWNVAAYDDAGDIVSEGTVTTKVVSLEYLAQKERERAR